MQRASKKDREEFVARLVSELTTHWVCGSCGAKLDSRKCSKCGPSICTHPQPGPEEIASFARLIMRHGATYGRLQEAQCNGDFPADNGNYGDSSRTCSRCELVWHKSAMKSLVRPGMSVSEAVGTGAAEYKPGIVLGTGSVVANLICPDCRTQDAIKRACAKFGVEAVFSGDPRGCTVKLRLPSGYTNDWGREGLCVPTA